MSDKPKIGSSAHAQRFPDRLSLYNVNYGTLPPYNKDYDFENPWWVDRGWGTLGEFLTYEEALAFLLEQAAK